MSVVQLATDRLPASLAGSFSPATDLPLDDELSSPLDQLTSQLIAADALMAQAFALAAIARRPAIYALALRAYAIGAIAWLKIRVGERTPTGQLVPGPAAIREVPACNRRPENVTERQGIDARCLRVFFRLKWENHGPTVTYPAPPFPFYEQKEEPSPELVVPAGETYAIESYTHSAPHRIDDERIIPYTGWRRVQVSRHGPNQAAIDEALAWEDAVFHAHRAPLISSDPFDSWPVYLVEDDCGHIPPRLVDVPRFVEHPSWRRSDTRVAADRAAIKAEYRRRRDPRRGDVYLSPHRTPGRRHAGRYDLGRFDYRLTAYSPNHLSNLVTNLRAKEKHIAARLAAGWRIVGEGRTAYATSNPTRARVIHLLHQLDLDPRDERVAHRIRELGVVEAERVLTARLAA